MRRILKVFIRRFQKTEIEPVHRLFRQQIRPKQNAVREFQKQFPSFIWLPSQLRSARADIDINIGISLKQTEDASKILPTLSNMRRYKRRLRMPRNHTVALIEQILLRILRPV